MENEGICKVDGRRSPFVTINGSLKGRLYCDEEINLSTNEDYNVIMKLPNGKYSSLKALEYADKCEMQLGNFKSVWIKISEVSDTSVQDGQHADLVNTKCKIKILKP